MIRASKKDKLSKTFLVRLALQEWNELEFERTVYLDSDVDHIFGWMEGTSSMQKF
jgi:hypothetical protein